jgi:N-methylhydantoinase A
MERALRRISVERGYDPRDFTLVPFGGDGGLHAVDLALALGIPRVIVPRSPGALSAIGVAVADVVNDQSQTVMLKLERGIEAKLDSLFRHLERAARTKLRQEGVRDDRQRHERSVAMRYQGQSFELEVKVASGDLAGSFHRAHLARYGYAEERNSIEVVTVRLRSSGLVEKRKERGRTFKARMVEAPEHSSAYFGGKKVSTGVYEREDLSAGMKLRAPCIVKEYSATTLIPAGTRASVDRRGNLIVECAGRA